MAKRGPNPNQAIDALACRIRKRWPSHESLAILLCRECGEDWSLMAESVREVYLKFVRKGLYVLSGAIAKEENSRPTE